MTDIIWAAVAVYTVGVAVWLIYSLFHSKEHLLVAAKNEQALKQHGQRIDVVEQGLLHTQKELLATRDSVTRIENKLGPDPTTKTTRRWPGGA